MKFWIKLWIAELHDPKMALLPDRLWRRAIECNLMAGEHKSGEDGALPTLEEMSWLLRIQVDILESQLVELQNIGILNFVDGQWIVVNFHERQRSRTSAERSKEYRKRQKKDQHQGILWDEMGAKRDTEERRGDEKENIYINRTEDDDLSNEERTNSDEMVDCPKCGARIYEYHLNLDCLAHVSTSQDRRTRLDYLDKQRVAVAPEEKPAGIDGNPDEEK
jgi:hypothetical protein